MSNIERRYAKLDEGVFPEEGEYGVTYLTLYSSDAGNVYDGWVYDPENKVIESETPRTYGYRNPDYPQYCWDDELVVDLSNAQARQESSDFIQGRITSFNTNVSSRPIVLQDIDITGLTEDQREAKATTVLFCAIPLIQDAYIQAQVEVQCKCNLSPDNTSGEMRIEAFYILNDESDRTMRPNPVHTFTVSSPNERHTLPWLYWNPALRHEDHNYIGVKLICTGGTAEIGISDNPDYGDAMITLGSAGMTGDKIDSGKPVRIWIEGEQLVPLGYRIDINDYDVFCEYDTGEIYVVTHFCTFSPAIGEAVEENFTLQAWYMGLHATLRVQVALVDHIEIIGVEDIYDSYTLDINDYTVLGYLENGDIYDVTEQCGFFPEMGTTLTATTTLTAMFVNPGPLPVTDELTLTKHAQRGRRQPSGGLIYTLYDDDRIVITGNVAVNSIDNEWNTFNHREGIVDPFRIVSSTSEFPEHVLEWRASGKPSSILLGNYIPSNNRKTGSNVWFVNFAKIDCSEMMFVDLYNQKRMNYATLSQSLKLQKNKLRITYGALYSNSYILNSVSYYSSPIRLYGMENIIAFDQRDWDFSKIKGTIGLLSGYEREVKLHDLSSIVYTASMFHDNENLETVEIDGIIYNEDENNVMDTSMYEMFYGCKNLKNINIINADYSKVTNIQGLFFNCSEIDTDAPKLLADILSTGSRVSLREVFRNCLKLRDLNPISDIDFSETDSVAMMFYGCISLVDVSPISGWVLSHVYNFDQMFFGCDKLRVISPLSGWDIFMTRRHHDTYGEQYEYQKMLVSISAMFCRSPMASYINDGFASTHILDANGLNWAGYKQYAYDLWDAYVNDGLAGSSVSFPRFDNTGYGGPGWPGSNDIEIHWDVVTSGAGSSIDHQWSDVPSGFRHHYGIFGGTAVNQRGTAETTSEHGIIRSTTDVYAWTKLKYPVPEWWLCLINWGFNRNLPYGPDKDAHWNGDRDVPV